ncbi:hypothetical protein [Pseudomonas nitroreducens]|uniref:hypothetical protein n=1 Tax=Pseudomonas TaxID=286 RepID=UPI00351D5EF1
MTIAALTRDLRLGLTLLVTLSVMLAKRRCWHALRRNSTLSLSTTSEGLCHLRQGELLLNSE